MTRIARTPLWTHAPPPRRSHSPRIRAQTARRADQVRCPSRRPRARHARKLQHLHAKINAEATAIAGADFADHPTLGFDEYESIAAQQTDNEGGCSFEGAGIVDVIDRANTMAYRADRVVACKVPPALTSE